MGKRNQGARKNTAKRSPVREKPSGKPAEEPEKPKMLSWEQPKIFDSSDFIAESKRLRHVLKPEQTSDHSLSDGEETKDHFTRKFKVTATTSFSSKKPLDLINPFLSHTKSSPFAKGRTLNIEPEVRTSNIFKKSTDYHCSFSTSSFYRNAASQQDYIPPKEPIDDLDPAI